MHGGLTPELPVNFADFVRRDQTCDLPMLRNDITAPPGAQKMLIHKFLQGSAAIHGTTITRH